MEQLNLMDMNLKTSENIDFADETAEKLKKLEWHSPEGKSFFYDDDDNRKLSVVMLKLKGIRTLNKKGKFVFSLERYYHYSGLEECIADEIKCKDINELEQSFQNEIDEFESLRKLPKDVLFDGHRYCWKFKEIEGKVYFTEKWMPEIKEEEEIIEVD